MNKKGVLIVLSFLLIILGFNFVSSIRINEFESNPIGTDAGNEWIELYNENEIDLTNYSLKNYDDDIVNLTGNFSGWFVYIFNKGWLDNADEKVFLYYNGELVDETLLFDDSKNDDKTWNFCDGEWLFLNSSKNLENNCPSSDPLPEPEENTTTFTNYPSDELNNESLEINESSTVQESSAVFQNNSNSNEINGNSINEISLNTKDIKTEKNINFNEKNYSWFYLLTFCMFLLLLFLIKRKNKPKNEFRKES